MADTAQPLDEKAIRADERNRVRAITECEEADGRTAFARHLAFSTDMDLQTARGFLAASEKAAVKEEKKEDSFVAQMRTMQNPNVGASSGEPEDDTAREIAMISAYIPASQKRRAN